MEKIYIGIELEKVLASNWKAYKKWFEKNKDFEWENPTFEGMLDWLVEQEEK